jgi:hypothetical protein
MGWGPRWNKIGKKRRPAVSANSTLPEQVHLWLLPLPLVIRFQLLSSFNAYSHQQLSRELLDFQSQTGLHHWSLLFWGFQFLDWAAIGFCGSLVFRQPLLDYLASNHIIQSNKSSFINKETCIRFIGSVPLENPDRHMDTSCYVSLNSLFPL